MGRPDSDDEFIPCTDERCKRIGLHPAHKESKPDRIDKCPRCSGAVTALRKKRLLCIKCGWRGSRDPRKVLLHA